jgi:hypothetical protein
MKWQPVSDGEYGEIDTIRVEKHGSFVTINSAYGNGSRKSTAMMPLPNGMALCRQVPDEASVPSEVYIVMEWLDGVDRVPIAVCQTQEQAEGMIDAFRDIVKVAWLDTQTKGEAVGVPVEILEAWRVVTSALPQEMSFETFVALNKMHDWFDIMKGKQETSDGD